MRIINEWGYHSHANWKTEHMGCKNMSFCVSFIICGGSTAKCQTPGETDCTQVVVSLCCWEAQDVAGMMILTPRWPMRLSLNTILSGWLHSIQYNLVRNPKFLTDNRHGSCKSRVLICNINTPLLYSEIATLIDILLYVILWFEWWGMNLAHTRFIKWWLWPRAFEAYWLFWRQAVRALSCESLGSTKNTGQAKRLSAIGLGFYRGIGCVLIHSYYSLWLHMYIRNLGATIKHKNVRRLPLHSTTSKRCIAQCLWMLK